jgi:anionic cell wall polymer biosynthesis LytR-Cps2A-Psr (LCP) family protein
MGHMMSTRTVEDIYDIKVNYQALANFDTIVKLVDIMGGIVVDNPTTFGLWEHGFKEGPIWLDGYNALLFSRARKSLENGDVDRVANQQIVIQGIFNRITNPEIVIHYADILDTMTDYFRTNIPPVIITQLFSRQIALGGDWTIEKMVAQGTPAKMPTYSMGDMELDVLIPDEQSVEDIHKAISDFMDRVD